MTARTIAVLKANFKGRDPYDQFVDLVDSMVAPQDNAAFAGNVTVGGTLGVTGASTIAALAAAAGTFSGTLGVTGIASFAADVNIAVAGLFDPKGGRAFTYFELIDDFLQQTLTEADEPWILNSGTDPQAIDPAIAAARSGVLLMTTGDDDGTAAVDAVQIVAHIPVQAQWGGLVFEARLHINTAITNVSVNIGFTDITTLEEPFSIGGSDVITDNADDAACFVYDTSADTDQWFMCATDGSTQDTGNAVLQVAPTADVYQVFKMTVSADGATIAFYIDGTLLGTLSGAAGVSPDVSLYATVVVCGDSTASKTVDVDYIKVGHTR